MFLMTMTVFSADKPNIILILLVPILPLLVQSMRPKKCGLKGLKNYEADKGIISIF